MIRSASTTLIVMAIGLVQVAAEPLSGDAIRAMVSGKNVYLSTPYGLEFPLRYNTDGTVSGDASGFSMAKMLAPKETGSWWVRGPKLCQKWKSWHDGKTLCFTIIKTGKSTISWKRDDGLAGTARITG